MVARFTLTSGFGSASTSGELAAACISACWLSLDAPFNPGVYAPAHVHHRSDETGEVQTTRFGDVDQYVAMVEDFADTVLRLEYGLAFPLESSLGNQRAIDQILA
ncbi:MULTISPECIES: hypothetical protein [Paraburkholderia]|uniref:hypothetical protein n=1 Tax=Paraburkholderia TaxID=1822464 RepID=UPI001655A929|nr:hypothetical protein [Paraburkholderia podalyriae]